MDSTTAHPVAFFSYCRDDAVFALQLTGDLKAAGARVWLDQLDILAGDRWDRAVEHALNACTTVLVLLSPKSVASTNVMDEVSFALEEKKVVIPILYQDCTIPFRLRRVHYVDFRGDYDQALQLLLRTLRQGEPSAKIAPAEPILVARDTSSTKSDDPIPGAAERPTYSHVTGESQARPAPEQARVGEVAAPDPPLDVDRHATLPVDDERPSQTFQSGFVASSALILLAMSVGYQLPSAMLSLIVAGVGRADVAGEHGVRGGQCRRDTRVPGGWFVGGSTRSTTDAPRDARDVRPRDASHLRSKQRHSFLDRPLGDGIGIRSAAIPNVAALSSEYVTSKRSSARRDADNGRPSSRQHAGVPGGTLDCRRLRLALCLRRLWHRFISARCRHVEVPAGITDVPEAETWRLLVGDYFAPQISPWDRFTGLRVLLLPAGHLVPELLGRHHPDV